MNMGIIGGADGPTAIFVTTAAINPVKIAVIAAVILLICAGVALYRKNDKDIQ